MYAQTQILELRSQRAKLITDAQAVPMDSKENRAKADQMLDDSDVMLKDIERMERSNRLEVESRGTGAPPNPQIQPAGADDPETMKKVQAKYHADWIKMMKFGWAPKPTSRGTFISGISDETRNSLVAAQSRKRVDEDMAKFIDQELRAQGIERRDMGTGGGGAYPGSTTGFFVPVGFVDRVEMAMKFYGPMLDGGPNMPKIFDTATGQQLPFPTDNDTATMGELVGESQQVTSLDVSISQILLGAYKYSSKLIKISLELLQDSAFDMETYLVDKFGDRLGRILNNHFTVGTGTSQPNGIVTAATAGVTFAGSGTNDGTSGANTIGSDDLINLEHAIDPLYRGGALYMFHDQTLRSLKTIKDKYGRPLWLPGLAVQAPDTINSYGYRINNDMAQLQSAVGSPPVTNKTVLFGKLDKYLIRRVKEMSVIRLEERFADFGQIAFLAFARYDGQLLDAGTHPVKYGTNVY